MLVDWLIRQWSALSPAALAAVTAMLLLQRLSTRLGMWAYALLSLPGTLAHELAHYVVALVLGSKPHPPSLWPQRTPRGWRLGSVTFQASTWRAVPIAMAPLALLPLALWWSAQWVSPARGAWFWGGAWLAATLLNAGLPSRTDLRIAMPGLVLGGLVTAVVLWLGHAHPAIQAAG